MLKMKFKKRKNSKKMKLCYVKWNENQNREKITCENRENWLQSKMSLKMVIKSNEIPLSGKHRLHSANKIKAKEEEKQRKNSVSDDSCFPFYVAAVNIDISFAFFLLDMEYVDLKFTEKCCSG